MYVAKQKDEPHREYAILEETTAMTLKKKKKILHFKSCLAKVILGTEKFMKHTLLQC